jgi:hypothetical protein
MICLRGCVLLFAVRIALVASLQTRDLKENAWPSQDLFQIDEDNKRLPNPLALVRTGSGIAKDKTTASKPKGSFPHADWCSAIVTSNLGGLGPDTSAAPELRYGGIEGIQTEEHVKSVDIVVTALSGYKTKNPDVNGFNNGGQAGNSGCFGIINLDDTDGGSRVDLEFKFVETGTENLVHVDIFEFLLYDIDMGADHTAIESLTVYNDIDRYVTSPHPSFSETGTLSDTDSSSSVTFTATEVGDGADNPTDPSSLTPEQINKTFIGIYKDVDKFKLTFGVSEGKGGRNFMFSGQTVSTAPTCSSGDCVIWGDPHVLTFDAHREFAMLHPNERAFFQLRSNQRSDVVNVLEEGQFWLVKSDDVHIQGRYNKRPHQNTTVLGGLAIGGPFLKGNTFIVRPLVGKITWNGNEVLSDLGSEFSNDLIDAKYKADVKNVKDGSKGNGLEVTLPGDVKLVVNRLTRGLAVKISMCAREWQDGQCGNFNGVSKDDRQNVLMERVQPLRHKEALPWREHLHPSP